MNWRAPIALSFTVVVTVAACADDGNDRLANEQRAAELAAELRTLDTAPATAVDATVDTSSDGGLVDIVPSVPATQPPPTVERTGVVVPVAALDNTFRPELVQISVGDEVLWENRGMNEHNVLWVEGDDWGVQVESFQPGAVYAHVFSEPGEYRYYCSIHGNETVGMVGTIVVTE